MHLSASAPAAAAAAVTTTYTYIYIYIQLTEAAHCNRQAYSNILTEQVYKLCHVLAAVLSN